MRWAALDMPWQVLALEVTAWAVLGMAWRVVAPATEWEGAREGRLLEAFRRTVRRLAAPDTLSERGPSHVTESATFVCNVHSYFSSLDPFIVRMPWLRWDSHG